MKKIILPLLASALCFTSCNNEDDTIITLTPEQMLVGTWSISKFVTKSGADNSEMSSVDADDCTKTSTYQFMGDKNLHFEIYMDDGTNCSLVSEVGGYYHYDVPNKILTCHKADNTKDFLQLVSLDEKEMVILQQVEDYNGDGMNDRMLAHYVK